MAMAGGMQSLGAATADGPPSGYEPLSQGPMGMGGTGGGGGGGGSMAAVSQLFTRLAQEIEEQKPKNCIHFVVDFLCKHYPEHLHGFASIWQMDPDLERERHEVVNFFKAHKISTAVAAHFTNAGYDTLDTLTTLSPDSLVDVEAFNNVKWLPGHKVRLQQIFSEISARVRAYRQQYGESAHPRRHHQAQSQHNRNHSNSVDRRHDSPPPNYHRPTYSQPESYSAHPHQSVAHHGHDSPPQRHHVGLAHHPQAGHVSPVVHPHVSYAPAHHQATSERHVAFTGGFSGGYVGGFAPPQTAAPHVPTPHAGPGAQGMSISPGLPNPSGNIFLANNSLLPPT